MLGPKGMQERMYLYLLTLFEHICFRKKLLVLPKVAQLKASQYCGGDSAGSTKRHRRLSRCALRNV